MQLLRIPSFIPMGPIRRRRSQRVALLRAEDAKIQAARHARITAARTKRHPQTPHKVVARVKPSVPAAAPTPPPAVVTRVAKTRGTYANDFSRRASYSALPSRS